MLELVTLSLSELKSVFGFGVAGNFAGHLEQAGEAADFERLAVSSNNLPKGIFPWYVPNAKGQLGVFPLSSSELIIPKELEANNAKIQIEPELGLVCQVKLDDFGRITNLLPMYALAFDDCSIRRPNAKKISEKKNWGYGSKGVSLSGFKLNNFSLEEASKRLRIASFLQRDKDLHEYGVDSAAASYMLFREDLLQWLVDKLETQKDLVDGPLEDVGSLLKQSFIQKDLSPKMVLIGIGATRYEPYGEKTFVEDADEAIVVIYDSKHHKYRDVYESISMKQDANLVAASVLRRRAKHN